MDFKNNNNKKQFFIAEKRSCASLQLTWFAIWVKPVITHMIHVTQCKTISGIYSLAPSAQSHCAEAALTALYLWNTHIAHSSKKLSSQRICMRQKGF